MLESCLQSGPHYLNGKIVKLERRVIKDLNSAEQSQMADNTRTLFVVGLDRSINKEDLEDYFSHFGKVTDGVVMLDKNGESKGFGFVTFTSALAVQKCFDCRPHFLHGKVFDVEISTSPNRSGRELPGIPSSSRRRGRGCRPNPDRDLSRAKSMKASSEGTIMSDRCLFVGQLDEKVTLDSFKEYFQQWGKLTDWAIRMDYGFVTFKEPHMLKSCLQSGPHYLNRKMVNLKRRVFRELNSDEQSEVADNIRELFIRGLDPSTTKQDMIEYFSQFGKVTDGVVMLDKNQDSLAS